MKTPFCIIVLIVFSVIAYYLEGIVLNLVGLPGILIARGIDKQIKKRSARVIALILTTAGQAYTHLAFTAFIVGWTFAATGRDDVVGFLVWPFAFLAALYPIHGNLREALQEAAEMNQMNIPTKALHITYALTVIGFFVFAFIPTVMRTGWRWVPYVSG